MIIHPPIAGNFTCTQCGMNHPMVEQQFQYTEPQICKAPLVNIN